MTGPIVIERQTLGGRVRVEASNPRARRDGGIDVDVSIAMFGTVARGTVILLAHDCILTKGLANDLPAGMTGCGPSYGRSYAVTIDSAFTSDQQEAILDALADWSSKVPVTFETIIGTCSGVHDNAICIHPSANIIGESADGDHEIVGITYTRVNGFEGLGDVDGGECWVWTGYGNFRGAAEHEAGHAMGLQHTPGATDLMNVAETVTVADCVDVGQWRALRGMSPAGC